jgi:hypothetical protein
VFEYKDLFDVRLFNKVNILIHCHVISCKSESIIIIIMTTGYFLRERERENTFINARFWLLGMEGAKQKKELQICLVKF